LLCDVPDSVTQTDLPIRDEARQPDHKRSHLQGNALRNGVCRCCACVGGWLLHEWTPFRRL